MSYSRDDYTVAWICALPLEMTAAKLMLEKVHALLPQLETDYNTYTLGSVGGHNVVVACLPSGVYGTTSAAIVLAHMLSTFPSLRFALMVGIGGGVPKSNDIRLGDVVVSLPSGASGGVVQYDYGKALRDGSFQRTGSLNKPPRYLLTAVSQIRSDPETSLEKTVKEAHQKSESIRKEFSRPSKDWLFEATYDHNSMNLDCSTCDQTQLVDRRLRESGEPLVHYGLIASGNQVIKNAQLRDSIAQKTGILCFEMEAAGLMDQLPCLVIRGICDYCDSHKHKEWQGYGALTAAAYAAHLLHAVPVTDHTSSRAQNVEFTEEEKACLRSLFITDPEEDKNSLKRRKGDRAFDTCSWIFDTEELQYWLGLPTHNDQEEQNILWLYGNPGTGKSTMAITLSEELPSKPYFQDGGKTIAYFFCDSSSDVNRTAISVLRGLLYQLIKRCPTLMLHLLPRYIERKDKLFGSFDALWTVLLDIAKISDGMDFYYIIDALDECEPDSQETLLEQIHQTFGNPNSKSSAPSNIHFLITSRPYHEIRRPLSAFRSKDLATYEEVASDLRKVIKEKVEVLSKRNKYPKALSADISRVLEAKAEGTFLWVGIACDELAQVQSRNSMKTLQALPRGLNSLYQKLLETAITGSNEGDEPMILEMLTFVAFALRPLTLAELSEACQLYPEEEEDCRLQFTQEIIDLCRLMIVVQGSHVRLLHKSVKDFLLKGTANINDLKANATLAHRCLNNVLHNVRLKSTMMLPDARDRFLSYSTVYWPRHASLSKTEFTINREHENFFSLSSTSWNDWMGLYNSLQTFSSNRLDLGFSTLHAAARWGIQQLIQFAINVTNASSRRLEPTREGESYIDSDYATSKGVTPMIEAARSGQISILKILLERGPPNQQINQDVMKAAARNTIRGEKIVAYLLDEHKDQIKITNDMIKVVSQNRPHGTLIMRLIIDQCKEQILVNPYLIITILEKFDVTVVAFLLNQYQGRLQITEGMIEAAGQNYSDGNEIMTLMLEQYNVRIQENPGLVSKVIQHFNEKVVELILNQMGDRIELGDEIFKAAARNYRYENVMFLLLGRYGEEISIATNIAWPGVPYISNVEYNCAQGSTEYNTWQTYAAQSGASAVQAFVGYWRCINREAGDRYWNVPFRRNPNFVAQNDEIAQIKDLVLRYTVPARILVCGLNGVGKTHLALELAYRIREHDPEWSIFWISSSSAKVIEQSYMEIAKMLGFYKVEQTEAKNFLTFYLCQKQAGKCLLIFDNAENISILTEYLPRNELAQILITSRAGALVPRLATDHVIQLSTSSVEAALDILENSLVDKSLLNDQETAKALVQRLSLLPLAILHASAYINSTKKTVSQYLYLLERQYSKFGQRSGGPVEQNYSTTPSLKRIWRTTFQQISRKNQLAAYYLSFMACMDGDGISQSLLPSAKLENKLDAIGLLKDSSIIVETSRGYFSMHRLLRHEVRDWLKSDQRFRQEVLKVADHLSDIFPNYTTNRSMRREYLPHAMSLLAEVEFQEEQARYIKLMRRVGHCLLIDKRYSEAAALFETIMTIQKNENSDSSYSILFSVADLARTYKEHGRVDEAEELELQMVELSKRVITTEYPDTLEMIRQSLVRRHQRRHEKAEIGHGQELKDPDNALELELPDTLHYFSDLGLALDRHGRHEDAENMHILAFGGLYKVLGPEDYSTLTGIFSLAYSLLAQDKKEDASTLLEEFIKLRGKSLKPDQTAIEDASFCRSHWEDYCKMRLFRKQQQEQKMISSNEKFQLMEDTSASTITTPPVERHSANPAQRFIRDHPLLRASRSDQSVQDGLDLEDVD